MKKIFTLSMFLLVSGLSFGQLNPVRNLTWVHGYEYPFNQYSLNWLPPDVSVTDSLKGYNVYRDEVLWRFQTGIGLSCMPPVSCNDPDFLLGNPFWIKVTAVYNGEGLESIATDSILDAGILIGVREKTKNAVHISPNPIQRGELIKVRVTEPLPGGRAILYNSLGVMVRESNLTGSMAITELNTGDLPSGFYYVQVSNDTFSAGQRVIIR